MLHAFGFTRQSSDSMKTTWQVLLLQKDILFFLHEDEIAYYDRFKTFQNLESCRSESHFHPCCVANKAKRGNYHRKGALSIQFLSYRNFRKKRTTSRSIPQFSKLSYRKCQFQFHFPPAGISVFLGGRMDSAQGIAISLLCLKRACVWAARSRHAHFLFYIMT